MPVVRLYVVSRDFGFAPNPFHGVCTLATCKPKIRKASAVGDWVIGVGGERLGATGRLIFTMQVTEALTFDAYWADPRFAYKCPVRNGSRRMIAGDNIYRRTQDRTSWLQSDSHHSHPDGTPNTANIEKDTGTDRVLVSERFFYFGKEAPAIPPELVQRMIPFNRRGHRTYRQGEADPVLEWLLKDYGSQINQVLGNPFDFGESQKRYSPETNRIVG